MDFGRLSHPWWLGVVLPLALAIGSTFTPGTIRGWLLIAAVAAVAWTFHHTEFGGKRWRVTGIVILASIALAIGVFYIGQVVDGRSKPLPKKKYATTKDVEPVPGSIPTPSEIEAALNSAYRPYEEQLGTKEGDRKLGFFAEGVYQAQHQKARILRSSKPALLLVLKDADSQWKKEESLDHWPPLKYQDLGEDRKPIDFLERHFRPPKGLLPPYGLVAYRWDHAWDYWKRMVGWRERHCNLCTSTTFLEFSGGMVIGPIRVDPQYGNGIVVVLLNDGNVWKVREWPWSVKCVPVNPNEQPCN
jgi:hypothetical protein